MYTVTSAAAQNMEDMLYLVKCKK